MSLPQINHTQISNAFIDEWMRELSPYSVVLFLIIARKTIGWHKACDKIGYSQLVQLSGFSINAIKKYLKPLVERGLVFQDKVKHGKGYMYSYEIDYERLSQHDPQDDKVYHSMTGGVSQYDTVDHESVSQCDTTKDIIKDTIQKKNTVPSNDGTPDNTLEESKTKSDYQEIVNRYYTLHETSTKAKPQWGGRQGKELKELLSTHKSQVILDKLESYYQHDFWFNTDKKTGMSNRSFSNFKFNFDAIPIETKGMTFEEMAQAELQSLQNENKL